MNGYRRAAKVAAIALPFIALSIGLWQLTRDRKPKWNPIDAETDIEALGSVFDDFLGQFDGDVAKAKFAFAIHCRSLREAYVVTHSTNPLINDWLKRYDAEVKRITKLNKPRR